MNAKEKKRYNEIVLDIERLQNELKHLNPYAHINYLSNKEFGNDWSENYIVSKVPSLRRYNGTGFNMISNIGTIDVVSTRILSGTVTFNQLHPDECDWFLFVFYNIIEGTEKIYFVPSELLKDKSLFKITKQHGSGCYCMTTSPYNMSSLKYFIVHSWEELNGKIAP